MLVPTMPPPTMTTRAELGSSVMAASGVTDSACVIFAILSQPALRTGTKKLGVLYKPHHDL
jgi:hypothetical protein